MEERFGERDGETKKKRSQVKEVTKMCLKNKTFVIHIVVVFFLTNDPLN